MAAALDGAPVKETGAFLSGGTDSSTVLGYMARLTGERVPAFSIGFHEERYDELHYADLAARHFNASHDKHIVTPDEALGALPRLVEAYDEPFGNNSAIGTYLCARLARDCGVRRLLAGDGGDEIFGGNERYASDRIFARYHRVPAFARRGLIEPAPPARSPTVGLVVGKAQRYVRRANLPTARRLYSYGFFFAGEGQRSPRPRLPAPRAIPQAPWRIVEEHFDRAPRDAASSTAIMYMDIKLTLGDNDLVKVTRTAERAGVGVRFPFLDRPLVEFTGHASPPTSRCAGWRSATSSSAPSARCSPPRSSPSASTASGSRRATGCAGHAGFRDLARETLLSPWARGLGYFRPGGARAPVRAARGRPDPVLRRSALDGADAAPLASAAPGGARGMSGRPGGPRWSRLAAAGLHHAGLLSPLTRAVGYVRREPAFPILTYHRVNDDGDPFFSALPTAVFERQMRHVARHYRVLPLEDLVERLQRGGLPRNALAITFDDGYRDNLTHAAPILARLGLPATIFLATGFIGTAEVPWFDRLAQGLKKSPLDAVRTPWGEELDLAGRRRAAARHGSDARPLQAPAGRGAAPGPRGAPDRAGGHRPAGLQEPDAVLG